MDDKILALLDQIKSNKTSEVPPREQSRTAKADKGKLDDLMNDIDNEFAELDKLLQDANIGQDGK